MEVNVQNQCVRVYIDDQVINVQPLVVLTQDLSGVAQQSTLLDVQGKIGTPGTGQADTLFGAIANINIDTSTIAKQGTNASATLTATQTAATNAYASAEAAKTGVVDGNDTAISVSKEIRSEVGTGSDTAAESGTLFAVVKWVKDKVKSIFNLIGSPESGQPSTLFAAIAAGGGGGGETITYPTIQMTAASTAIDPNKVYIWGEMSAITITALNAGEAGVANVYFLEFYSGSTATTLTLPASVTDVRGSIAANAIVNVAILNGVAYIA